MFIFIVFDINVSCREIRADIDGSLAVNLELNCNYMKSVQRSVEIDLTLL